MSIDLEKRLTANLKTIINLEPASFLLFDNNSKRILINRNIVDPISVARTTFEALQLLSNGLGKPLFFQLENSGALYRAIYSGKYRSSKLSI